MSIESLEQRCLLAASAGVGAAAPPPAVAAVASTVELQWAGPTWSGVHSYLTLTETKPGATPVISVVKTLDNYGQLRIDLGAGHTFTASSRQTAHGLTWQNSASPQTSQFVSIDVSAADSIELLTATLPGDRLALNVIQPFDFGINAITASAASIDVINVDTAKANGNIDLRATGNLTVAAGAVVASGAGTIALAADVRADGMGDDGQGTLTIRAGATVVSANAAVMPQYPPASAVTLRGADIDIDAGANPALVRAAGFAVPKKSDALAVPGKCTALACDRLGNVFVANYLDGVHDIVSEFAPGSTLPTATLTGVSSPRAMAFDSDGNLYVANDLVQGTVSKFAPGGTVPIATLTGLNQPVALVFDASGNLYVANNGANTVSKFAPGGTAPIATLTGLNKPIAMAFNSLGMLYVANAGSGEIDEFSPGNTTRSAIREWSTSPCALAFDADDNLYVSDNVTGIRRYPPGFNNPNPTQLTGPCSTGAMTVDTHGNLFVVNDWIVGTGWVFEFAPWATTPILTLDGLPTGGTLAGPHDPGSLALDASGNLYATNTGSNTVVKYTPGDASSPSAGAVTILSSLAGRPISLGGTNQAVAGVNLTDAELARIQTTSTASLLVGDSTQTGNIIFSTATPATTPGASLVVSQDPDRDGQIVLDDGAGAGTALNGNGGTIRLTAGSGGIVAAASSNRAAEIATTGATVTLNTNGPLGAAGKRLQFADNANTAQQIVIIGTTRQPSGDFLDGLGSLTLGGIAGDTLNATIDVTARGNLVVAAGATITSGLSALSLGADLQADGSGDDGNGTLSLGPAAVVISPSLTLRGADVEIDTSANPAQIAAPGCVQATIKRTGLAGTVVAVDAQGNLYAAKDYGMVSKYAPASTTPTANLGGLKEPTAIAFDAGGNVYVANLDDGTVRKFAPGGTSPAATLTGLYDPDAMIFDAAGNLYVDNGAISKFAPGSTTPTATLQGSWDARSLAFDSAGNLYAIDRDGYRVYKYAPGSTASTDYLSIASEPWVVAVDSRGNVYVADAGKDGVSVFAPGSAAPMTNLNGTDGPVALAFDANDNLYVANEATSMVSEYAPGATVPSNYFVAPRGPESLAVDASGNLFVGCKTTQTVFEYSTASRSASKGGTLTIRSSLPNRPINLGGANHALAGINLTDAELKLLRAAAGLMIVGDVAQTGDIAFTSVAPIATNGAAIQVVQSPSGPGQIILDDEGSSAGLDGNGGTVTLKPGTGGMVVPLAAAGVPLASQGFDATGLTLDPTLTFAPALGTQLLVINNTALPASARPIGAFANLPQGAKCTVDFQGTPYVFAANYQGGDGNDLVLTVVAAPAISALSPASGPAAGGTTVTITGTNFDRGVTAVKFGNVAASSVTVISATQITAKSPLQSAGAVDVTVTTAYGTSTARALDQFLYVAPAKPGVIAISPAAGPMAGGTIVTIAGTNLANPVAVKFGGVAATIKSSSATQIVAVSPPGAAGAVDVTVTTAAGTSASSLAADKYSYVVAPTVTRILSVSGPAAGGTSVTLYGQNLALATMVRFGAAAARIVSVSATKIVVLSPAGTGTVNVTVVTPGGTSAVTAAGRFTYLARANSAPAVLGGQATPATHATALLAVLADDLLKKLRP